MAQGSDGTCVSGETVAAGVPMGGEDSENLDAAWQFNQELRISIQMVNARRIATCEPRHRFNAFPVGDRDELGLIGAVFTERLDAHRLFDERLDTNFVVVGLVCVGDLAPRRPRQIRAIAGWLG